MLILEDLISLYILGKLMTSFGFWLEPCVSPAFPCSMAAGASRSLSRGKLLLPLFKENESGLDRCVIK